MNNTTRISLSNIIQYIALSRTINRFLMCSSSFGGKSVTSEDACASCARNGKRCVRSLHSLRTKEMFRMYSMRGRKQWCYALHCLLYRIVSLCTLSAIISRGASRLFVYTRISAFTKQNTYGEPSEIEMKRKKTRKNAKTLSKREKIEKMCEQCLPQLARIVAKFSSHVSSMFSISYSRVRFGSVQVSLVTALCFSIKDTPVAPTAKSERTN